VRAVDAFSVVPGEPYLPSGLDRLRAEAEAEAIRNVPTLVDRWLDGSERYDRDGERVLAAIAADEVVGIGALSRCPTVPDALRVRRFYVSPAWRRRGVARRLATTLLASGFDHAETITCNAGASDAAAPFWERMGFARTDITGVTHVRRR
jgi:GNAT superfamily N-acetyltransferase